MLGRGGLSDAGVRWYNADLMALICPWWLTYTFDNPLRRLVHNPRAMLGPYVEPGMRVADLGCGGGHFTLGLADLVGPSGHVQAVDLQPESLARVRRRLERAELDARVTLTQAEAGDLRLEDNLDFVLAFWMVHEVPDPGGFFRQIREHLATGGRLLVVEPRMHVTPDGLAQSLEAARYAGLRAREIPPRIGLSRSALLERAAE
jgi:ubiquinone/menaquinone biosynthesis C-methylase UbiE